MFTRTPSRSQTINLKLHNKSIFSWNKQPNHSCLKHATRIHNSLLHNTIHTFDTQTPKNCSKNLHAQLWENGNAQAPGCTSAEETANWYSNLWITSLSSLFRFWYKWNNSWVIQIMQEWFHLGHTQSLWFNLGRWKKKKAALCPQMGPSTTKKVSISESVMPLDYAWQTFIVHVLKELQSW